MCGWVTYLEGTRNLSLGQTTSTTSLPAFVRWPQRERELGFWLTGCLLFSLAALVTLEGV